MKQKKAQMQQIGGLAVGVAVITISLIVAFLVMVETEEAVIEQINWTVLTTSENITSVVNNTEKALANSYPVAVQLTCQRLLCGNRTTTVDLSRVSCDREGVTITLNASEGQSCLVNYSYRAASDAYNSTIELREATATIPGWIPLVIVAFIGSIALGLTALIRRQS